MTTPTALGCGWGLVVGATVARRAVGRPARERARSLGGRRSVGSGRRVRTRVGRLPGAVGVVGRVVVGLVARGRRRAARHAVERAVPPTLDVVTMALRAGAPPRRALALAAPWCPAEVADDLAAVERRCRLGEPFADSLATLATTVVPLAPLADVLALSARDGAPAAERLAGAATAARADLRRRAEVHARRVSVRLLFPLVFLVLPAFGLLTVVPALADGLHAL